MRIFPLILLLFFSFGAEAGLQCRSLFERPSASEFLDEINDRYEQAFFENTPQENIEKSSFLSRHYKLFKLKRMFRNFERNGEGFDQYEIANFVYKLDRLAFAERAETATDMTREQRDALSEARRSVLAQGIIKYFDIKTTRSGFWSKFGYYFGQSMSWKYWRWLQSPVYMPKLMGTSLPPELAEKVLLEGLDAHRAEVEKYVPLIKGRSYFNTFSKVYNTAILISLFTVVPYMTHDYYQHQMEVGRQNAAQIMAPLVQTSNEMAKINFVEQKVDGALDKYIEAYHEKYGRVPTDQELAAVRILIQQRVEAEVASYPKPPQLP